MTTQGITLLNLLRENSALTGFFLSQVIRVVRKGDFVTIRLLAVYNKPRKNYVLN